MRFSVLTLAFLIYNSALAQDWQTISIDTLFTGADERIVLQPQPGEFGGAIKQQDPLSFPTRFWLKGDWWLLDSHDKTGVFYVFGKKMPDSLQLWAAGYSFSSKKITFGKVEISDSSKLRYNEVAQKSVEIIDHRQQYAFMFIFFHDTHTAKIEVNGVPMRIDLPASFEVFDTFGYMAKGCKTGFQVMKIRGR